MGEAVTKEIRDGVAILAIDKPKMNQLSGEVFEAMRKHLDAVEADKAIRCVIITGAGEKAFSAGADLASGFGDFSAVDFLKRGQDIWNKVEYFPKPVIAAINGHALGGGCELAMMCDFIIAADTAKFGQPEINLGVIASEVHQLFGRYRGTARTDDGEVIRIDDLIGFAEEHHARW